RGAAQHNLKHVDIAFPRDRMTVCTGVSGSGKTSFAIDTVYTEGHRRYVESLSAYARQFLGQMQKPKVEHIEGLSPAICIEQKAASKSPRSTVGTITEIYDYLRVLWARVGTRYCPRCDLPIGSQTVDEIVSRIMALPAGAPIILLAPVALGEAEGWASVFTRLKSSGYTRVRIDGAVLETAHATTIDARRKHRVEVVVDRTVVRPKSRSRITEAVEHALMLGNGLMTLVIEESHTVEDEDGPRGDADAPPLAESSGVDVDRAGRDILFSQRLACTACGTSFEELSPHNYSFNSQMGWCETCEGLGVQRGAPAASIIRHPTRGLLDGAIAGWGRIDPATPFGRVLVALCRRLGVAAKTPLEDWTAEQRQTLLYGTTGDWIAVPPDAPGKPRRATGESKRSAGESAIDGPYRFHWRGFFPAIDNATRNSWSLRHRLHNVVTDIPCITCRGGRLRADAAATRLVKSEKRERSNSEKREARSEIGNAKSERRPEDARSDLDSRSSILASPSDLDSRFSILDYAPTLVGLCQRPLHEVAEYFRTLKLSAHQREIAGELVHEIRNRLQFLLDVGLEYLTLHRAAPTLSGGEAQRIRLASQIGSGLSGVLYVLDEPTIGLHPRDTKRLVAALSKLRALGNTLLLVEHDREVIAAADRILDFGPRAGRFGGEVVAQGTPADLRMQLPSAVAEGDAAEEFQPRSLTRGYLSSELAIAVPSNRRVVNGELGEALRGGKIAATDTAAPRPRELTDGTEASSAERDQAAPCGWLVIRGARQNNLKNINVPFPLGRFVCVTGVSGSGKSSLINDILWPALANRLMMANLTPGEHDGIDFAGPSSQKESPRPSAQKANARLNQAGGAWRGRGARLPLDKVINVDQSPLGATPSSNPATYTGVFDLIRELFARLPDSKLRGYNANRFSFNRPGGRCEACEGYGQKCIEMHFMPDVWVECEVCQGRRYEPETLQVRFKEKNISDVLDLPISEALALFESVPKVRRLLQMLVDVGLGYVQLGQPAPTLSGGEAQRVKLASELGKPGTGRTLYILDEPTTGLHFDDVRKLLDVLHRLADLGNTIVCVEHNLDVLKSADWIIDLGPEAGDAGGQIVALGTPEDLVRTASVQAAVSHTTAALAPVLAAGPVAERQVFNIAEHLEREAAIERAGLGKIGREVKQPWQIDGRKWHLSQRTSRDGKATRWKPEALEFVITLVQEQGGFAPTNWNDRASVEITAAGAEKWFSGIRLVAARRCAAAHRRR
ncbi:MAG: hypothetical protein HZB38_08245, partial [Planctomycetes bacterium]|nr:hypothetical protein [Planctomycetota bacterium]